MDYPGKVITKTQVTPTQTSASGNWTLDDQAAAIKNNNWPVALVPNPISKSLRFNSADSAYLNRTLTTPTDGKKWTYSFWIKRVSFATNQPVLTAYTDANNQATLYHTTGNKLYWLSTTGGSTYTQFRTDAVYRDASAWYHFVVVFDSTNATSTDRIKMYVNGTSLTCEAGQYIAPGLNTTAFVNTAIGHRIGNDQNLGIYLNGYLTEVNFIDGQALTPSDFGLTNPQTGQWIPKKYTGTYGTNGFYLNFKDATSTTTLGYDYSGNANNWTTNNFSVTAGSGNDSLTDVPTPWVAYSTTGDSGGVVRGNYCTMNPLDNYVTLSNGNLQVTYAPSGSWLGARATMRIPKTGKWKWELTPTTLLYTFLAIAPASANVAANGYTNTNVFAWFLDAGEIRYSNVDLITVGVASVNDVCEVRIDNGVVSLYRNGTLQYTYTQTLNDISGDYFAAIWTQNGAVTQFNFGQRPFAYTPSGYSSLCTTNLPATTIGFGLTNQGDDYFNTVLYTGNGSTNNITGVGFQPDFVWLKDRTTAFNNYLYDAVRGTTKALQSNSTNAEETRTGLTAFGSDGFTLGSQGGDNQSGDSFVAWNWKAGGTGVTNTSGSITSTVSANTTAGFSVVTYTGTGVAATVGHGLGVAPSMIIVKDRDDAGTNWCVYHVSLGNGNRVLLNLTNASAATGNWNSTSPTSSVFSIGVSSEVSANNKQHVAYCFAAVAGYSAFGSYTGNGSADGPFVYTGFRPRYLMVKEASGTSAASGNWVIYDAARDTYNVCGLRLVADNSYAEGTVNAFDFLSNGFKLRTTDAGRNESGGTYIYAAFAESPFQFANAR